MSSRGNRQHKSTRLDKDIVKGVEQIAEEQQRSFSNMLEVILSEYLESRKKKTA